MMLHKVIDFLRHGVWERSERSLSGRLGWALRQLRVILFTARGFNRHDTSMRSAALSFYTVMSLVPILALVFVIFKGFGMEAQFNSYLYDLMPNYTAIVDQIVIFIQNLLGRTRGGVMAVGAFFVLIWAVIQVFGNVEGAFNKIWEVKRSRSVARRITAYMALVIVVPILLLAANSLYGVVRSRVEMFTGSVGADILFSLGSVAILIFMFSLIYYVLPNTEVKYVNALKAGVVAAVGYSIFQLVYVVIQGNLSSYNAIYGTFAAIPLFLLWLQTSWQILLFGGELSFAMQNIRDFELERELRSVSPEVRCKIMVAVMVVVIRDYLAGQGLATPERAAHEIGVPVRTVRELSGVLEDDGLVLFVGVDKKGRGEGMAPARDPHTIRFFDVVAQVSEAGDPIGGVRQTALMKRIDQTWEKVKGEVADSVDNVALIDLI